MENPNLVISPDFCVPEHTNLTMVKKVLAFTDGNYTVTDDKGNTLFKVTEKFLSMHNRHFLLDPTDIPIVTIMKKVLSAHKRWLVYGGDSSDSAHLLLTAKTSSMFQLKTEIDVFRPENKEELMSDFKVIGSWFERSCRIYNKNSVLIAKMQKKHTIGSLMLGKDKFDVTVHPQVDRALIVALIVILREIDKDRDD